MKLQTKLKSYENAHFMVAWNCHIGHACDERTELTAVDVVEHVIAVRVAVITAWMTSGAHLGTQAHTHTPQNRMSLPNSSQSNGWSLSSNVLNATMVLLPLEP